MSEDKFTGDTDHIDNEDADTSKQDEYKCDKCSKVYSRKYKLDNHACQKDEKVVEKSLIAALKKKVTSYGMAQNLIKSLTDLSNEFVKSGKGPSTVANLNANNTNTVTTNTVTNNTVTTNKTFNVYIYNISGRPLNIGSIINSIQNMSNSNKDSDQTFYL
jgi:hypothetical protein